METFSPIFKYIELMSLCPGLQTNSNSLLLFKKTNRKREIAFLRFPEKLRELEKIHIFSKI